MNKEPLRHFEDFARSLKIFVYFGLEKVRIPPDGSLDLHQHGQQVPVASEICWANTDVRDRWLRLADLFRA